MTDYQKAIDKASDEYRVSVDKAYDKYQEAIKRAKADRDACRETVQRAGIECQELFDPGIDSDSGID